MAELKDDPGTSRGSSVRGPTEDAQLEKFPSFMPTRKLSTKIKSRSFTEAEINEEIIGDEDLVAVVARLKSEGPPPSLKEARERRASIKEQRRERINMIRSRTASRASNSGRPSVEVKEKSSTVE